jgi:hypothetical protein
VPPRRVFTSRRGALGAALGAVLLAACDVDDLRPPDDDATPVPSPTPGATETPEPDDDVTLAEEAGYDVAVAMVAVEAARRRFPRLRARLQPLVRMHRAHLRVLDAPEDRSIPAPDVGATPAEALERVRLAEQTLQQSLVDAAVEAQSGALARLLASTSASVSQHLAALPPAPATDGEAR